MKRVSTAPCSNARRHRRAGTAWLALGVLSSSLVLWSSSVQAGLFEDDEAREAVLQLREQRNKDQEAVLARMDALSTQMDRLSRSLLDMNTQLDTLRAELARLRGQDEVLSRDLAEVQQRQKELQQGLEERVRQLEPKDVTLDGKTFKATPDEVAMFEKALQRMRDADFPGALNDLSALFKQYPQTGYRESALYWQGNAHYALRAYKPALDAFQALLALNPRHQRAAEAMLSVASCHTELKEQTQARKILQTLLKDYPETEAAQVARERLAAANPTKPLGTATGAGKAGNTTKHR